LNSKIFVYILTPIITGFILDAFLRQTKKENREISKEHFMVKPSRGAQWLFIVTAVLFGGLFLISYFSGYSRAWFGEEGDISVKTISVLFLGMAMIGMIAGRWYIEVKGETLYIKKPFKKLFSIEMREITKAVGKAVTSGGINSVTLYCGKKKCASFTSLDVGGEFLAERLDALEIPFEMKE
jgi:hypothetical protein